MVMPLQRVGTSCKKSRDVRESFVSCDVERGLAKLVSYVRFRSGLKQESNRFHMSLLGSFMESCGSQVACRVHVRTRDDKGSYVTHIATITRQMERSIAEGANLIHVCQRLTKIRK